MPNNNWKSALTEGEQAALESLRQHDPCEPALDIVERLARANAALQRALEAQDEIIKRLPKTTDGVAVAPDDPVYYIYDRKIMEEIWTEWASFYNKAGPCYSTHAAAEAALNKEQPNVTK